MTNEQAALKLSLHLFQCGMLMPIKWLETNGKGSDTAEAFRLALAALRAQDTPNPPLTLEELQGMDGEPVWIEPMQQWRIVAVDHGNEFVKLYTVFNTISAKSVLNGDASIYRRKQEEGKMMELKIGDKVVMNDKYHVSEANKSKIWVIRSAPWNLCGSMVVLLEGKSGGYAVDGLDLVEEE